MAWIIDGGAPFALKLSPSSCFNNLTADVASVAYVHKGVVSLCGLDGKIKRALNSDGGSRAFQVLLCSGEDFDFMVVALDTGVQVWSSDGKRMIYFFSSKGSGSGSSREEDDSLHTQGIAMVPKGRIFVVGCSDGDVFAFKAKCGLQGETAEFITTLKGHERAVVCAGADKHSCVTGDAGGTIISWNVAKNLKQECSFKGKGNPTTAVCVREETVVAAYSTGHVRIFDISNGTSVIEIAAHSRATNAIDLHPDSMLLATVGDDSFLNVWELPQGGAGEGPSGQVGLVVSSKVPNRLLTGVKFLADGSQRIAATSYDCTILHLWHKL